MCYSAQVRAEYNKFRRETGAAMDLNSYMRLFWWNEGRDPFRRPKLPRALERDVLEYGAPELADLIRRWDAWEIDQLTQEIFAQRRRVGDAQRALRNRDTKRAREDVRIGTNKVKGKESDQDHRIHPGVYCPVLAVEDGSRVVKLMRYQCRRTGKPAI